MSHTPVAPELAPTAVLFPITDQVPVVSRISTEPFPSVMTGAEPPEAFAGDGPRTVARSFAFLDLCGSTVFLERHGAKAALEAVTAFRATAREVAARRGVRVAKWMGDGALLVGLADAPVVAATVELAARCAGGPLAVRAGVASSPVLLFDGDDYLGRGANLASRLCDSAAPGEVLVAVACLATLPGWVDVVEHRSAPVAGLGVQRSASVAPVAGTRFPPLNA